MVRGISAASKRMLLFLYNFQQRKMLGVFVAAGRAGFPLHEDAWRHGKGGRTDFPAQACNRSQH